MTEKLIMDLLSIAACVVAGASVINQMTPDADNHPKFAAWIDYLSLNVRKAQNDPHNHPWTTLAMQMNDPNDPRNMDEVPAAEIPVETPNRRAAIEATKRKHEARDALVG